MVKPNVSGSPGGAERVIDSVRRSIAHAESEYVVPFSVPTVMDTVSTSAELEWSDCLAWVAPISSEMTSIRLEASHGHAQAQRNELLLAYLDAVRAGDGDRVMSLFGQIDYVGSAVRA
ncbi:MULTISPECIES: hypothetical protein [unclassified Streptomyces]|uniref:hypothetical protein n=1 Tax=unclassified Streptomyces TaxID=2593676 RepID=UPI00110FF47F|nr:hypothetical protein [Streptomyces sp. DASNCL29]TMU98173.1 hypothetical protein FGK60_10180 [Streptomyces sp. DASNCL29]